MIILYLLILGLQSGQSILMEPLDSTDLTMTGILYTDLNDLIIVSSYEVNTLFLFDHCKSFVIHHIAN
jgi:hypothetical protein